MMCVCVVSTSGDASASHSRVCVCVCVCIIHTYAHTRQQQQHVGMCGDANARYTYASHYCAYRLLPSERVTHNNLDRVVLAIPSSPQHSISFRYCILVTSTLDGTLVYLLMLLQYNLLLKLCTVSTYTTIHNAIL